jgi:hypothetical protein
MRRFVLYITGGRPMICMHPDYFTDCVTGETVKLFVDKYGRRWMAAHKWSWFRVSSENPTNEAKG